ncbi:hypothetical protein BV22DRAFT_1191545 [Leucogyrophana mollusca]|uniref:Uncharacterized protein n=1 Tax=Leucogyrophana mollusca TaxID=85980 RepID=A0ACB8BWQ2_9AGAM|nr:hypothetical protein BV22DRAFT_1191545 [Leucogyrophana mollusca]
MSELSAILRAGSFLLDKTPSSQERDLKALLSSRLTQFYASLGEDGGPMVNDSLEEIQLKTAQGALRVVERVQQLLDYEEESNSRETAPSNSPSTSKIAPASADVPAIGTRDLTELRTLLSMIFRWGVEPLLARLLSAWPTNVMPKGPSKIIDLTNTPDDYKIVSSIVSRLMDLLFPRGPNSTLPQTLITTTILNRHLSDILRPCVTLGWLPKSLASDTTPTMDGLRPLVLRLLAILPPSQTISALGAILSGTPPPPPHVRKSCSSLLSRQLLRPEGVRGLCAAVFGEQDNPDESPLEKYEHVARVLTSVPAGMKPSEYFGMVVPRIITLISTDSPTAYKRAASFTLSRMLATDGSSVHQTLTSSVVLSILHTPFAHKVAQSGIGEIKSSPDDPARPFPDTTLPPNTALSTLTTLLLNTDPSPTFISAILSPIVPALYALLHHMDTTKVSDPVVKESVKGLLATWGRVVERREGIEVLWAVLQEERIDWDINIAGDIKRVSRSDRPVKLSLLTPEDIKREEETGELDPGFLDLYPNPDHFVEYLKSIDRSDMSSELFVRLLEAYHDVKITQENDPMRVVLYLQLIMQMQTQLSGNSSSSNILSKPEHILSFVKHALEPAVTGASDAEPQREKGPGYGLKMEDLRIVPQEEDVPYEDGDSDDEEPGTGSALPTDDEMAETAINLLLATLEANPGLSARNVPVLNDIFSLLEPWANGDSQSARSLAREARMVMTARLASTSSSWRLSRTENEESAQEIYQKALKLLQDPILPVRAHGLLLLRQLVSSKTHSSEGNAVDPALVPAILSIFMQSVQDDDSYIFLNAVQGLSAMVDTFGKDVLSSLVETYTQRLDGLSASTLTQQEMDTRVRIGEALGQVIKRCGDALAIYANLLVPHLAAVFRSSHLPTVLRTSAISLLTECVKTSSLALLPYIDELSGGMIDLLQVEMVPLSHTPLSHTPSPPGQGETGEKKETLDSKPTSTNSRFPPLRRAALYFLSLLIRTSIEQIYEGRSSAVSGSFMRRARVTLGYVASTDADDILRVMAREAVEGLDQLQEAMVSRVLES